MSGIFVLSLLQEKTNFTTVMLHLECCNKQGIWKKFLKILSSLN